MTLSGWFGYHEINPCPSHYLARIFFGFGLPIYNWSSEYTLAHLNACLRLAYSSIGMSKHMRLVASQSPILHPEINEWHYSVDWKFGPLRRAWKEKQNKILRKYLEPKKSHSCAAWPSFQNHISLQFSLFVPLRSFPRFFFT